MRFLLHRRPAAHVDWRSAARSAERSSSQQTETVAAISVAGTAVVPIQLPAAAARVWRWTDCHRQVTGNLTCVRNPKGPGCVTDGQWRATGGRGKQLSCRGKEKGKSKSKMDRGGKTTMQTTATAANTTQPQSKRVHTNMFSVALSLTVPSTTTHRMMHSCETPTKKHNLSIQSNIHKRGFPGACLTKQHTPFEQTG